MSTGPFDSAGRWIGEQPPQVVPPMPPGDGTGRPLMYGYVVPTRPLPPPPPTNGLGIAGFVTGLVGLVLFWIPFVGAVLAATGIVLSAVGMAQGKKNGSSTGLAIAGLVLGILGVLAFVAIVGLVAAVPD